MVKCEPVRFASRWSVGWWVFFFSSRRRHTRSDRDWSSDVCSSDLVGADGAGAWRLALPPRQHGDHEVRAEHGPAEPARARKRRREIERAGAEIDRKSVV